MMLLKLHQVRSTQAKLKPSLVLLDPILYKGNPQQWVHVETRTTKVEHKAPGMCAQEYLCNYFEGLWFLSDIFVVTMRLKSICWIHSYM